MTYKLDAAGIETVKHLLLMDSMRDSRWQIALPGASRMQRICNSPLTALLATLCCASTYGKTV
jgi:hypothetical protein